MTKVQEVFVAKHPWKVLKQVCNQCNPRHQHDELQAAIGDRAKNVKPVGRIADKIKKRALQTSTVASLCSDDVVIPPGVFRQKQGTDLCQLKLLDINPSAAGVVVGTEEELSPFIGKTQLTSRALALLVMDPSSGLLERFGPPIKFPV